MLRKKPAGKLISNTAHQVEREYTILRALHTHNQKPQTTQEQIVPVPEPIILCEDTAVIGTPFYVMEYLDGRIFTDPRMPEVSPETRRAWCVLLSTSAKAIEERAWVWRVSSSSTRTHLLTPFLESGPAGASRSRSRWVLFTLALVAMCQIYSKQRERPPPGVCQRPEV